MPDTDEQAKIPATRAWWVKLAGVVVPAIVSGILATWGAGTTAKTQADEVKDKAESGYQFVREALTELRDANKTMHGEVAKLTLDVADLRRRIPRTPRRLPPVVKVVLPAPPPAPVALPPDLDKALVQQKQATDANTAASPAHPGGK